MPDQLASDSTQATRRFRRLAAGILVGLALATLVLVWIRWHKGGAMPRLTRQDFDAAFQRWSEHGPDSYQLDVTVQGNQPGQIHVEVRDGAVTAMTRDGITPSQRRTWDYWSVPGQFDMILLELDSQTDPHGEFGGVDGSNLVLWAEFDPHWGYPRRYRRVLLGARQEMEWEVTRFEPLEPR
ncbi:MAG: DUF6174 domain-containing protein [Pirellulales bacterium]